MSTRWICLTSSLILFIHNLLFISGREAQDIGQVQPTFDRKTVCGSDHHWKGVVFYLLYLLLQSFSPIVGWWHLTYIKADGCTEDLPSFIRGSECFRSRRVGFSVAADNLLPCTIVANSLGLNFQDDIFGKAACATVDGSMTIRTLVDVAVRLKWNGAIKSFLVQWAPISVAQIMRSISVLAINPRWAHFEPQITKFLHQTLESLTIPENWLICASFTCYYVPSGSCLLTSSPLPECPETAKRTRHSIVEETLAHR